MLEKNDVNWYSEGASLEQKDDGVEIHPIGEPTLASLYGKSNREEHLDPNSCFLSVPGGTRNGFKLTHQLSQGGHTFGSFKPNEGSMAYLDKGVKVDSESQVIEGTHARDYVQYGRETISFLPGYTLS